MVKLLTLITLIPRRLEDIFSEQRCYPLLHGCLKYIVILVGALFSFTDNIPTAWALATRAK